MNQSEVEGITHGNDNYAQTWMCNKTFGIKIIEINQNKLNKHKQIVVSIVFPTTTMYGIPISIVVSLEL